MCDCLQLTIRATTGPTIYVEPIAGTYNGSSYWYFTHDGQDIYIWDIGGGGTSWLYSDALGGGTTYGRFAPSPAVSCPEASLNPNPVLGWTDTTTFPNLKIFTTLGVPCPEDNCGNQDRTYKRYESIKLPEVFQEQDRDRKSVV